MILFILRLIEKHFQIFAKRFEIENIHYIILRERKK